MVVVMMTMMLMLFLKGLPGHAWGRWGEEKGAERDLPGALTPRANFISGLISKLCQVEAVRPLPLLRFSEVTTKGR